MSVNPASTVPAPQRPGTPSFVLLTPKEAATRLKVSTSWLAKARMRGDGPPYIKVGRAIRYSEAAVIQWMKSRQRLSTSELQSLSTQVGEEIPQKRTSFAPVISSRLE
jgi:predicted DNA-binding transcriptional regulator AlpA